jgi:phage protein D
MRLSEASEPCRKAIAIAHSNDRLQSMRSARADGDARSRDMQFARKKRKEALVGLTSLRRRGNAHLEKAAAVGAGNPAFDAVPAAFRRQPDDERDAGCSAAPEPAQR